MVGYMPTNDPLIGTYSGFNISWVCLKYLISLKPGLALLSKSLDPFLEVVG